VYLFGDDSPGRSAASGIGAGSSVYISGKEIFYPPLIPSVNTNVVAHEIGHLFNLYHTFGVCSNNVTTELPDGSNCSTAGDFVCDTPADPGPHAGSEPGTCLKTGYLSICTNSLPVPLNEFQPDSRLIMSYNHPGCLTYFTPGQGERMRNAIASFPHLQAIASSNPDCGCGAVSRDWVITDNTIIDQDRGINGNIYLRNGASLTVTATLKFAQGKGVFVEGGSHFMLDGGTLTRCDNAAQWKGVWVQGRQRSGFLTLPGRVSVFNDGTIMHAAIGIDGLNNNKSSSFPIKQAGARFGGGIININNGKIQLCSMGLRFGPYGGIGQNAQEQSKIVGCHVVNCKTGIYLDRNIGLTVNHSVFFQNLLDIESHTSAFEAIENEFNADINLYAQFPVVFNTVFKKNLFFNSSIFAESQSNVIPLEIQSNQFNGGGCYLLGESNFNIANNGFSFSPLGVIVYFTNSVATKVYDNSFYDLGTPCVVYGNNDVEFRGNCYSKTLDYDIELYTGAAINQYQGDVIRGISAGNCFDFDARIHTAPGAKHFFYLTNEGFSNAQSCKDPGNTLGFTKLSVQIERPNVECSSEPPPPGIDAAQAVNCQCKDALQSCFNDIEWIRGALSQSGLNGIGKHTLNACLDEIVKSTFMLLLEQQGLDAAIQFSKIQPEWEYQLWGYGLLMHAQRYFDAGVYLNTFDDEQLGDISASFLQHQTFALEHYLDSTHHLIDSLWKLQLVANSLYPHSLTGFNRSHLQYWFGEKIVPIFQAAPRTRRSFQDNEQKGLVAIYPNPMQGDQLNISIDSPEEKGPYELLIYDLLGRLVHQQSFDENSKVLTLDLPSGTYLVTMMDSTQLLYQGTLIK
jgi:hypothetical protein